MNHLLDDTDEDQPRLRQGGATDREITLGTTTILLIFFALAVYGAVTFGFGYSMGSKRNSPGPSLAATPASGSFGSFSKPSPGSPVGAQAKSQVADTTPIAVTAPADSKVSASTPEHPEAAADNFAPPVKPPLAPPATAAPASGPPATTLVVQIAAVSHVEDAQLIATTLQKRGYSVNIMVEADKLAHVQVGPFTNRKDAEAMKARLLADGFNAYIK